MWRLIQFDLKYHLDKKMLFLNKEHAIPLGGFFFVSELIVEVKSIAQAVRAQHAAGQVAFLSGSAAPPAEISSGDSRSQNSI